jgi:RNA-directed DNA polymerase
MAGREIAPKSPKSPESTRSCPAEDHGVPADKVGRGSDAPDGVMDLGMPSQALCTETGRPRQGPAAMVSRRHGREGRSRNPQQSSEGSDAPVVPTCEKSAKTWVTPVESMEGRGAAHGKPAPRNASPAQDGQDALTFLERVGQRAKDKKEERFNNLLSHIKVPLLKEAYQRLRKDAAPGVDGVTWGEYGENLDARLLDLQDRVHRGSYHPQPVRRVHIPKGDGRMRPLGIPSLEDKIVQQAARMLLEPIYEREFLGFSYGFRPGRSPHQALDALAVAISRKVDWVLDADIRAFFDTIDHAWMQKFIEHKIADSRMVRLLMKWLHAGVMEDGELRAVREGTPQGGIISPLLANLYLHYVLDLWVSSWRKKHALGEVYVVRYADDFVMGFQREQDARTMHKALSERLATFGLKLHPDKTRVLRFGRFAHRDGRLDGRTRPETFDFLGFTHIIALGHDGKTCLIRRTSRRRRQAKRASLRRQMRERRHEPPRVQHAWLSSVLRGHDGYYGVPGNYPALASFHGHVRRDWHRSLQRRSQRAHWTRERRAAFEARFALPPPRITHPYPKQRFAGP